MSFTGTVRGENRAELVKKARAIAETYYGTGCVAVRLDDEVSDAEPYTVTSIRIVFTASFEAQEDHRVEARAYGPAECVTCNRKSWPSNPLPRARWEGDK